MIGRFKIGDTVIVNGLIGYVESFNFDDESCKDKVYTVRFEDSGSFLCHEYELLPYKGAGISNKELQERLKEYPDDATVVIEYCNIRKMTYDKENNLLKIE